MNSFLKRISGIMVDDCVDIFPKIQINYNMIYYIYYWENPKHKGTYSVKTADKFGFENVI